MITRDHIKVLGIKEQTSKKRIIEDNYKPTLDNMKETTKTWSRRKLSLVGQICIIKTLILSYLIYCRTVLPSPEDDYWKEVNTILYNFIAGSQTEKLKRNTLIGSYDDRRQHTRQGHQSFMAKMLHQQCRHVERICQGTNTTCQLQIPAKM